MPIPKNKRELEDHSVKAIKEIWAKFAVFEQKKYQEIQKRKIVFKDFLKWIFKLIISGIILYFIEKYFL